MWWNRGRAIGGSCLLCGQKLYLAAHGICSYCRRSLHAAYPPSCHRCALYLEAGDGPCGRCLVSPPWWDKLVAAGDYCPPLSTILGKFKFQQRFELAIPLARLLLLRWLEGYHSHLLHKPDLLLPVPLHRYRQWRRGFNQSVLLAKPLSRWLGVPLDQTLLWRTKHTAPQQGLNAAARKKNLRHAFVLNGGICGKRVALIDDVVTTGSTVGELSRILHEGGAEEIQVWTLCRTMSPE